MNHNQNTHGFFPKAVSIEQILSVKKQIDTYLLSESYPLYIENIGISLPSVYKLITDELLNRVLGVLNSDTVVLESVELHYLPPHSSPIPPHQDNFYHCLEGGEGLKVLIPLTNLNANAGGLYFLDCPSSVGVFPHHPSNINNFSSYIPADIFDELDYPSSTYNYRLGDASYHLLNSVHFSTGNQSEHDAMFLVFRYNPEGILPSLSMLERYKYTFKQHLEKLSMPK